MHPWGSTASSARYSELCPSDAIHLPRNVFWLRGWIFWDLCVGLSHMAPIDFNGSHAARNPCAPLGVTLSPDVCGCSTHELGGGEHTSALPCQEETRPPLHLHLHSFGLVYLWMSNNGDSFLWRVSKIYTINITLQGSDTVLFFEHIHALLQIGACWNISFEGYIFETHHKNSSIEISPFAPL